MLPNMSIFDEVIERGATNSVKWAAPFLRENFGADDVLPKRVYINPVRHEDGKINDASAVNFPTLSAAKHSLSAI